MNFLSVKEETLSNFGAVSEECIVEMAKGVREKLNTTYGLATSGIAGPDGGSIEKPVGTVYIAFSSAEKTIVKKLTLGGTRLQIIHMSTITCLNLLRKNILNA